MTTRRTNVGIVLFLTTIVGCASPPAPDPNEDRASITRAGRAFSTAFVNGDTAVIRRLYTEDAVLLPPGREVRGVDNVVRYLSPGPNRTQVEHAMTSSELTIEGNTAIDVGMWSNTVQVGDNPPTTATERYLLVWRRGADGDWRIAYDMWHRPGG